MAEAKEKQYKPISSFSEPLLTQILLHKEATDIAERLQAVAKLLKENPAAIDKLGVQVPSYEEVLDLTNRIKQMRKKYFRTA